MGFMPHIPGNPIYFSKRTPMPVGIRITSPELAPLFVFFWPFWGSREPGKPMPMTKNSSRPRQEGELRRGGMRRVALRGARRGPLQRASNGRDGGRRTKGLAFWSWFGAAPYCPQNCWEVVAVQKVINQTCHRDQN